MAHACRIASVNALPDACPAWRMLAISASLLMFRISYTRSFNGDVLFESRTLARPSAFGERSRRKRENHDFVFDSETMSVYTLEVSPTRGVRRLDILLISPVYPLFSNRLSLSFCGSYLVCVENVYCSLSARSYTIPLLGLRIFWSDKEVKYMAISLGTLS